MSKYLDSLVTLATYSTGRSCNYYNIKQTIPTANTLCIDIPISCNKCIFHKLLMKNNENQILEILENNNVK